MRDAGMEDKPKNDCWLFVTSDQHASLGILTIRVIGVCAGLAFAGARAEAFAIEGIACHPQKQDPYIFQCDRPSR